MLQAEVNEIILAAVGGIAVNVCYLSVFLVVVIVECEAKAAAAPGFDQNRGLYRFCYRFSFAHENRDLRGGSCGSLECGSRIQDVRLLVSAAIAEAFTRTSSNRIGVGCVCVIEGSLSEEDREEQ